MIYPIFFFKSKLIRKESNDNVRRVNNCLIANIEKRKNSDDRVEG